MNYTFYRKYKSKHQKRKKFRNKYKIQILKFGKEINETLLTNGRSSERCFEVFITLHFVILRGQNIHL